MHTEKLLKIDEVCDLLQLKKSSIFNYIKSKNFPHKKIGSNLRFLASEVMEWVENQNKED